MSRLPEALTDGKPQLGEADQPSQPSTSIASPNSTPDHGRDLIEEIARALARYAPPAPEHDTFEAPYADSANVPAPLPINDFEDDFPDDGPVPIPSTWLQHPSSPETSWLRMQARAAAIGLGGGLAVVIPLVLIISGQTGGLQAAWSSAPATIAPKSVEPASVPARLEEASQPAPKPRIIATTPVTTAPVTPAPSAAEPAATAVEAKVVKSDPIAPAPMVASLAPVPSKPAAVERGGAPLVEPKGDRSSELRKRGQEQIAAGNILAARQAFAEAAIAGDMEANLLLGETFDPNMLAAWGIKGASPDVSVALSQYKKALEGGIERARVRLKALE